MTIRGLRVIILGLCVRDQNTLRQYSRHCPVGCAEGVLGGRSWSFSDFGCSFLCVLMFSIVFKVFRVTDVVSAGGGGGVRDVC